MAGSKSHLIQNAREMVVSSDLTRIGKLAAREQQNAEEARAIGRDFYNPTTGVIDDFGASARGGAIEAIPSALVAPSLDGQAGTFDMQIGAGEVQVITNDTSDPDMSAFQIARWETQTLAWPSSAEPDSSLPRIATIAVMPSDTQTDQVSRNILLDPATRSFQPQNVYKTSNPTAIFTVVGGTPAAVPFPPDVLACGVALFDVLIPPSVSDSTAFLITRRCWRRIEFPGTSQHGIVKGCVPTWAYADEATGVAPQLLTGSVIHRLVMDGELMTFSFPASAVTFAADTVNAPGSAPAGNDKPTYLYLCGGRHWPWSHGVPVQGVESLTPPDCMGYPSAAMAVAGVAIPRNAALYIGVGFKVAGGTINKSLFYDGDWVRPQASTVNICGFKINTGDHFTTGSVTPVSLVVGGVPVPSTVIELQAGMYGGSGGTYPETLTVFNSVGGSAVLNVTLPAAAGATAGGGQSARTKITRPASDTIQYTSSIYTNPSTSTVDIRATGYNMNIPRIGS